MRIEVHRLDAHGRSALESAHLVDVLAGSVSNVWQTAEPFPELTCFAECNQPGLLFPRSAIKPLQATLLLQARRDQRLPPLDERFLACQCASHSGERQHVAVIDAFLKQNALSESNLLCGSHWPYSNAEARRLESENRSPSALHNNCSGKHAGLLVAAQLKGYKVDDYINWDHPLQVDLRRTLETYFEATLATVPWGFDGCSLPTYQTNSLLLWRALARWTKQATNPDSVESEAARAFTRHPELTSGTGEFPARLMALRPNRLLVKVGAEGIYFAADLLAGWCVAIKAKDGAKRASEVALVWCLIEVGLINEADAASLFTGNWPPEFTNWAGRPASRIHITDHFSN
jgi:L-asparaginase II